MKQFYFIRHGESLANVGGECLPDSEIPLTEKGWKQAEEVAEFFAKLEIKPPEIYTSEFLRTKQTAEPIVNKLDYETPLILPELNEFSYLNFEEIKDLKIEERQILSKEFWERNNPMERKGIDCFLDFNKRVSTLLENIECFSNQSLFFCHGMWLGLLAWQLYGFPIDKDIMKNYKAFQIQFPLHNTAIYRLDYCEENGIKQLVFIK